MTIFKQKKADASLHQPLLSLCHKHPPAAVLLASLHVLLLQQLAQELLHRRHTDARHVSHVCP